jgi:S-(hydroxymethyl)glutathione dehydrogenase / alcohol dehydrogenase
MKARAAVFHGAGKPLEIAEVDVREPGSRDVVVRMAAIGICGTDLHQIKGEWVRPTPMVLGHEGAGVVEEVGDEVAGLRPGDEVVLSWAPSCGECPECRRGRPATCVPLNRAIGAGTLVDGTTGLSMNGETVYRGTATGAMADRVVVSERVALPTGGDVPLDQAALLGCAALTGVGAALFAARIEPGTSAFVVGAGGVGQFVVQGARIAGAETIVCIDLLAGRRERVLELGATHAAAPDDAKALMAEVLPAGADYAFDAVGEPETTGLALRYTRNGGLCVIVGLPGSAEARLDLEPADFLRREKRLTGTLYGSEDPAVALPILLDHLRAGRLELASMVGPKFPLEQVNEAIAESLGGSPGRVLVLP